MENPRFVAAFAAVLAVCGIGCPSRDKAPEGFVVAREITDATDLIGGPRADGRLGDFLLANDHVRVIVGAAGGSVVFNPFGGQILDADVVRPAGEPGQDRFGEAFPSINLLTVAEVDAVEVAADGSNRRRAAIRVTGHGYSFPIAPEIPGLTNAVDVEVETIYALGPDDRSVLVETTVRMNETERTLVQAYDVLLFGAGLDAFGAPVGSDESGTFEWYGGDAAGIGYAWVPLDPQGTLAIPFSDSGMQIAAAGGLDIPAGSTRTYRRRLVIAAPDLGAAGAEIARVRGQSTGTLTGTVRDTVGTPVADAFVEITAPGRDANDDGEDDRMMRARSGTDGGFAVALPPGTYRAVVSADHRGTGTPLEFEIRKGKNAQILFVLPAVGTVSFAPTDAATSDPMPGKLTLLAGGSIVARAHAGVDTPGAVQVPPGSYTAYVSRGPEWEVKSSTVVVTAGGSVTIPSADSALARVVDTTGFVASDFHLHTVQSRDSPVPVETRVLSLAAEGLEYVVATDHDRVTDYQPVIDARALTPFLVSAAGSEVSLPLYAHFNAWPMPEDAALTRAHDGTNVWFDRALGRKRTGVEMVAALRALPGDRVVQMNHPRSTQGYLRATGYDPATGTADEEITFDVDTIEVNEEIDPVEGQTLADWFSFLKQGHAPAAVGVSDSHEIWAPGVPRTLVFVGTDDPATVTDADVRAALRAGRATVSAGPFVVASAGIAASSASVGLGETLDATAGGSVEIRVHVAAPAWAPFGQLVLYENGALHSTIPLAPALVGGTYASDVVVPVTPAADAFYVAVVTGTGSMFPVYGDAIYAYTNPVFVDVGTPGWSPPGL